MNIAIAYCIAGLSTFALIVLWFSNVHKVLYLKRESVYKAQEELRLHQNGYQEKCGSSEESIAKHMLDTITQIYEQIKDAYNKTFKKPIYRFPGVLMGFRMIT